MARGLTLSISGGAQRRQLKKVVRRAASRAVTSLQLPEPVVDAALDVDGKRAVAGNLHRRDGELRLPRGVETQCLGELPSDTLRRKPGEPQR